LTVKMANGIVSVAFAPQNLNISTMKSDLHPTSHTATVTCSCGETFSTLSTLEAIVTETCSKCHPFYTGKQKFVDSAQRVEKHQARVEKIAQMQQDRSHASKKTKHAARDEKRTGGSKVAKSEAKEALKAAKDALADL